MLKLITTAIIAFGVAGAAQADTIGAGTAGVGFINKFTVSTTGALGSFAATAAPVTIANTTGGFLTPTTFPFDFSFGTFNGTFSFSKSAGTTINETLPALLTFGATTFSASSVYTISFSDQPGVTSSGSVYLLGLASQAGFDDTATSLTLTFNSTGGSAYSASATLATPPAPIPSVPEPASWAMMLAGFGAIGGALRGRRKSAVSFG